MSEAQARTGSGTGAVRTKVPARLDCLPGQVGMRVLAGPPGRTPIQAARDTDAEFVVLAARGDGTVARLPGTVSQFVLRNAPCPVLVVPDTHRAAAHAWATTGAHTGPGAQPENHTKARPPNAAAKRHPAAAAGRPDRRPDGTGASSRIWEM